MNTRVNYVWKLLNTLYIFLLKIIFSQRTSPFFHRYDLWKVPVTKDVAHSWYRSVPLRHPAFVTYWGFHQICRWFSELTHEYHNCIVVCSRPRIDDSNSAIRAAIGFPILLFRGPLIRTERCPVLQPLTKPRRVQWLCCSTLVFYPCRRTKEVTSGRVRVYRDEQVHR